MKKIMLVEDEYHIRKIITEFFSLKGVEIIEAMNGFEAIEKMNQEIDLILLDIMMPGIDGYEVCRQIKSIYETPIMFISALSDEENLLKAYELGADDFLTKPFKPSILYAKCQAIFRRIHKGKEDIIKYGKIAIDTNVHLLIKDEIQIELAPKEYELLLYLCKREGMVVSREVLLNSIWGYDYYGDGRAVDTYIKKIRKKLSPYDYYIQTLVKKGYMFKVVE